MDIDFESFKKPFPAEAIEWRIGRSGNNSKGPWAMVLAYINSRAVMDRLDEVCTPSGWENCFLVLPELKAVQCTIRIAGVSKADAAEFTAIEAVKGGYSDAFKRAAVHWGIGRYLYKLTETWADCSEQKREGWNYAKTKDGVFYWRPPQLPEWALPEGYKHQAKSTSKESSADVFIREVESPPPTTVVTQDSLNSDLSSERLASPAQLKMIRAISAKAGYTPEQMKAMFEQRFGIDSHSKLTITMASQVIEGLKSKAEPLQKG